MILHLEFEETMKLVKGFGAAPPDTMTIAVCVRHGDQLKVEFIERTSDLLNYPDDTLVIVQERTGDKMTLSSEFTVGLFREKVAQSNL